jgi:hypothetical protein
MYDDIDDYVERSLKNWAARQRSPADGRQRLLLAAPIPVLQEKTKLAQLLSILINPNDPFERTIYPQCEWEMGPALSSIASTFHFAWNWRLVH